MKVSFLLPALLHALCVSSAPAPAPEPYVVTSYVELSIYTYSGTTRSTTTRTESYYTYTKGIIPTVTSVSAISTYTDDSIYNHVSIVNIVVVPGQGTTSSYDRSATATTPTMSYAVPITYTPNPTCSQNWKFVTNVPVYIPSIVRSQLVPVSTSTSISTRTYQEYKPTTTTSVVGILNPTDVDPADLSSASSYYKPYQATYSYCYSPTTICPTASASCYTSWSSNSGSSGSSGSSSSSSSRYYDSYYNDWLRTTIIIAVVVPVSWFLIWLIVGLVESWLSFKGLMLGQQRKRGLPYAWCCISWIFLCWVGPTYKARSEEEQAALKTKWDAMGAGEKIKIWLKWGFRWKYPVEHLGEEPQLEKRAFRQGCL
ncbi:hypothetical protein B0J14DRAFT_618443 [Halenospora varia]|nr:hypothetical protein B0J14DRAFT_618443 [Halenospora varia]